MFFSAARVSGTNRSLKSIPSEKRVPPLQLNISAFRYSCSIRHWKIMWLSNVLAPLCSVFWSTYVVPVMNYLFKSVTNGRSCLFPPPVDQIDKGNYLPTCVSLYQVLIVASGQWENKQCKVDCKRPQERAAKKLVGERKQYTATACNAKPVF